MDKKRDKKQTETIIVGILLLVSAVMIYITHRKVPFMMDDLWYATKLSNEEPIRNLADIVESQIWHYHNWGGRSMTHGLLQMILLLGEQAADVLNLAVTFLLSLLICVTADLRKGQYLAGIWAAVSMLTGLNANWKMSMFWQAGAANYLYITVFILLFLHCYLRETVKNEAPKPMKGITLWIIPLGVLAGWSNENMGPAVFLISIAVIFLKRKEKQSVPVWMYLGSAGSLIGSAFMILAPGNFVRAAQVKENEYGILWRLFLRCYAESKGICEYLFPTLLICGGALLFSKRILGNPVTVKEKLLLLGAGLSWGAMILSPHYPDRASFGTMVLLICVIISCGREIAENGKNMRRPLFWINGLVWLRGMFFLGEFVAVCLGWIR